MGHPVSYKEKFKTFNYAIYSEHSVSKCAIFLVGRSTSCRKTPAVPRIGTKCEEQERQDCIDSCRGGRTTRISIKRNKSHMSRTLITIVTEGKMLSTNVAYHDKKIN